MPRPAAESGANDPTAADEYRGLQVEEGDDEVVEEFHAVGGIGQDAAHIEEAEREANGSITQAGRRP